MSVSTYIAKKNATMMGGGLFLHALLSPPLIHPFLLFFPLFLISCSFASNVNSWQGAVRARLSSSQMCCHSCMEAGKAKCFFFLMVNGSYGTLPSCGLSELFLRFQMTKKSMMLQHLDHFAIFILLLFPSHPCLH